MYAERIVNMNARKKIGGSIRRIQPFYQIHTDIVSGKRSRAQILTVWIDRGKDQKNSHSGKQKRAQLIPVCGTV